MSSGRPPLDSDSSPQAGTPNQTENLETRASLPSQASSEHPENSPEQTATTPKRFPRKSRIILSLASILALALLGLLIKSMIEGQRNAKPADPNRITEVEINDSQGSSVDAKLDDSSETVSLLQEFLAENSNVTPEAPIDPLLDFAQQRFDWLQENVKDYTATLVKRERIGNRLQDEQFMVCKIRRQHVDSEGRKIPFSVYLGFTDPASVRGREVIWVKGQNEDRLIAHEGGWKNIKTLRLLQTSPLAKFGNRYPISQIGMDTLLSRLIEIGKAERVRSQPTVSISYGQLINQRPCSRVEIEFNRTNEELEFSKTILFLDDETGLPIRYSAFGWADEPNTDPPLLETYTYLNLQLNVGLSDRDFDPTNPDYDYR